MNRISVSLAGRVGVLLLAAGAARASFAGGAGGGAAKIGPENAAGLKQSAILTGHKMAVFGLASSPDGALLASAGIDTTVRLWDPRAGKQVALLEGHKKQAICVGFKPDGATLVSAGYEPAVRLWDVKSGKQIEKEKSEPGASPERPSVETVFNAFSPDASLLASVGEGISNIKVWDVKARTQREIASRRGMPLNDHFHQVAFSGDGRWLAVQFQTAEDKAVVEMWDVKAGAWGKTLAAPEKAFVAGQALAVNGDGSVVASVDVHSSAIQLWDAKTGALGKSLKGHGYDAQSEQLMIAGMAFSPDGRLLASASYDKTIRVWDVAQGKELASLPTHKSGAAAVVFGADGTWLASADLDGTLQVWTVGG